MKLNSNDWFYLESYVICEVMAENLVVINTNDEKYYIFQLEGLLNEFILELLKNSYCIKLKERYSSEENVLEFIQKSRKNYFGDIIDGTTVKVKPFIPFPIANYQKDENKVIGLNPIHGEDLIPKLRELTIYVNSECDRNCKLCNSYYKQTLFCTKVFDKELQYSQIMNLCSQFSENTVIAQINVSGANILRYEKLSELCELLKLKCSYLNLQLYYQNIEITNIDEIESLKKADNVDILINFPFRENDIQKLRLALDKYDIAYSFKIAIESEKQFFTIDKYLSDYPIDDYEIIPIFNGTNISFFEKHVFITENDLKTLKVSQNRYFLNKTFNINNYGKISLASDGTFYANINLKSLGHLNRNSIHEILYSEVYHGESWNLTRSSLPCKECVYQFICPPISNYEHVLGRNNLCHISG
ncbi:TIGR04150 pseudo-rSAM protein [Draconibacterium sp. IB214405]|uniref:TIGR04150 pseudo-rSAM protein n=1 Tax=Draconibacterium sp. IB214405 TaxID=3097352 RepID=UPI002A12B980|nr:TIGR04150 pseudo-rSAM protein [Draconibacterium sp. IB214405]MDX8341766.1 TIGR04150 pseudo-rSAM protein [Draconibacterium sp. IB214405]